MISTFLYFNRRRNIAYRRAYGALELSYIAHTHTHNHIHTLPSHANLTTSPSHPTILNVKLNRGVAKFSKL